MMDLKFKGPNWVGNIYQKFEAICNEVDDIVKQVIRKHIPKEILLVYFLLLSINGSCQYLS